MDIISKEEKMEIESNIPNVKVLDKNDTFEFGCDMCGKCCEDNDIMLTIYDIYNMCKFLKMDVSDFIDKYCTIILGEKSYLPAVLIKFRHLKGRHYICPFNDSVRGKNICTLHEAKPFICKNYPLGRVTTHIINEKGEKKVAYIIQSNQDCGNKRNEKKEYTLDSWFEGYDIEKNEEASNIYNGMMFDWLKIIDLQKLQESNYIEPRFKMEFFNLLSYILFSGIDLNKDIIETLKGIRERTLNYVEEFVYLTHLDNIDIANKNYKFDDEKLKKHSVKARAYGII